MKKIREIFQGACGITVFTLALFYLFAAISKLSTPRIGFGMFGLIFGFSCLIRLANELLSLERMHMLLRIAIHYTALLISFCVVFITSGNIAGNGAAAVFSAIAVFTFLYALLFTAIYFIKKLIKKLDNSDAAKETARSKYKPLYRDRDQQ